MNTTITDSHERAKFEYEDTAHPFFRTRAFEEFIRYHADDARKREVDDAVEASLRSFGKINWYIIDSQLINVPLPLHVRERISHIILKLEREI